MEKRRNPRAPNTSILKQWNVYLFIYLNFVNGGNEKRVTVQSKRREMMNLEQHVCNKADQGKAFCLRCKVIGWRFDRVALASRESFPFQLWEPTCSLASCIGLAACWRARASCESGIVLPACRRHHFFQANCCPLPVFFLGLIVTRIPLSMLSQLHIDSRWHPLPTTVPQKGSGAWQTQENRDACTSDNSAL